MDYGHFEFLPFPPYQEAVLLVAALLPTRTIRIIWRKHSLHAQTGAKPSSIKCGVGVWSTINTTELVGNGLQDVKLKEECLVGVKKEAYILAHQLAFRPLSSDSNPWPPVLRFKQQQAPSRSRTSRLAFLLRRQSSNEKQRRTTNSSPCFRAKCWATRSYAATKASGCRRYFSRERSPSSIASRHLPTTSSSPACPSAARRG
jgi:hypothetical protein